MSSAKETLTYNELREKGLQTIEEHSHTNWTDYNLHDPGITLFEYLCYALTDLDARTNLDMKDILASSGKELQDLFATAEQILPCRALTEKDYRKLLIDIPYVKNAWLNKTEGHHRNIYIDAKKEKLRVHSEPDFVDLDVKGFYDITVQFHDFVNDDDKAEILKDAWKKLHDNRNLCEDFLAPRSVSEEPVGICFDLHVDPNADIDEVMSEAACRIDSFISPAIRFYTIKEMLSKDYKIEDIFNGPFLSHGFIDDTEIEESDLRTEIHASDLIQILMDIPGILAVNRLLMTSYVKVGTDKFLPIVSNQRWVLPISKNKAPVFNLNQSRFIAYKNKVPYFADKDEVKYRMRQLKAREFQRPLLDHELILKLPIGKAVNLKEYPTIQNHFPLVYGIGQEGLPSSETLQRKNEARQFKAYILILEQLLANYLAQLEKTAEFFSSDDLMHTSYTQIPEDIRDLDLLLKDAKNFTTTLQDLAEDKETYLIRRNRFLDHLLSRFNETWTEYAVLAESVYGSLAAEILKEDKKRVLESYPDISHNRAAAYNYLYPEDSPLSGLEKRLKAVLGFKNYRFYQENDNDDISEYRFEIFDHDQNNLLSSTRHFHSKEEALKVLFATLRVGLHKKNYTVNKGKDGEYYFKIELKNDDDKRAFARKIHGYKTKEKALEQIDATITFLKNQSLLNKVFVLEHSLLRPHKKMTPDYMPLIDSEKLEEPPELIPGFTLNENDLLQACVDTKCIDCSHSDPYSFRITVVLPYAVKEFQNMNFRRYIERYIREHTPAHILAKICWIDSDSIDEFKILHSEWRKLMSYFYTSGDFYNELMQAQRLLIDKFNKLSSVYPTGYLHDCKSDDQKRPIVLGQSKLGIFEDEDDE